MDGITEAMPPLYHLRPALRPPPEELRLAPPKLLPREAPPVEKLLPRELEPRLAPPEKLLPAELLR